MTGVQESRVPSKAGGVRQMSKVKVAKADVRDQTRLEGHGSRVLKAVAGEGQRRSTGRSPPTCRQSPPSTLLWGFTPGLVPSE